MSNVIYSRGTVGELFGKILVASSWNRCESVGRGLGDKPSRSGFQFYHFMTGILYKLLPFLVPIGWDGNIYFSGLLLSIKDLCVL